MSTDDVALDEAVAIERGPGRIREGHAGALADLEGDLTRQESIRGGAPRADRQSR